jgi:hypothetical protein
MASDEITTQRQRACFRLEEVLLVPGVVSPPSGRELAWGEAGKMSANSAPGRKGGCSWIR